MKAVVLAAGYATRLYPLTETVAKPLLPVGGRPMVDWILDRVREVDEVDAVHVVTNSKFAPAFEAWAAAEAGEPSVAVHDDGTASEHDRLGAIGDSRFVVDAAGLDDDLLVIAGDNLFDFSLADYVAFWRSKGRASAVAVHDVGSRDLARKYGIVEIDTAGRVVDFVEKPDEPGNFIGWLHRHEPVYAYAFSGEWRDIGDRAQLLEADNSLRARAGMPQRTEYSL